MIRDRMPDLYASQKNSTTFRRGFLQDVHIQISQNKKLNKVLQEVEEIRTLIQLIVDNTAVVKDLHNNVLSYTNRDIQNELEIRTNTISQTAFGVKNKLQVERKITKRTIFGMGKEVAQLDDFTIDSAREGPAHMRIKVLQYTTMMQLFADSMQEYNESLIRYHHKCSLLLQQQGVLTKNYKTTEELDEMLYNQEINLFVDNILEDSEAARQQLSDLQMRHDEVLKLEKSLTEVRDMFVEMAFLVEKQGERLNCVEYFAGKATDNIDNGRTDLNAAEKRSHKYRKRKIKIIIIVSLILVVILLIAIFL